MSIFSKRLKINLGVSAIVLASVLNGAQLIKQLYFVNSDTKARIGKVENEVKQSQNQNLINSLRNKSEALSISNKIVKEFNHKTKGFTDLINECLSELSKLDRLDKRGEDVYDEFYRQVMILKKSRSDLKSVIKELKIIRAILPNESSVDNSGVNYYRILSELIRDFGFIGKDFNELIKQSELKLKDLD